MTPKFWTVAYVAHMTACQFFGKPRLRLEKWISETFPHLPGSHQAELLADISDDLEELGYDPEDYLDGRNVM